MRNWSRHIVVVGSIGISTLLIAQEKPKDTSLITQKEISEVVVKHLYVVEHIMIDVKGLNARDIEMLNTDDVAGLIAKTPGATVKSYGGLGGLKSISIRGLGGQHTAVLVDGFLTSNAQAGQLNLGQLQSDGMTYAEAGIRQQFSYLHSVSSNFYGSYVQLNTFMKYRPSNGYGIKSSVRYGSFQRREAYVQGDRRKGRWHYGAFGKYRDATGAYPFEYLNGLNRENAVRGNNDYRDIHAGVKLGRDILDHGRLNIYYRASHINQGLPGAVLFYNETSDERMLTEDHRIMLDYETNDWNNRYRIYLNTGLNRMEYYDPTYFNAQGFIHDTYANFNVDGGYIHYRSWNALELKWGGEQRFTTLGSSRESLGNPVRSSSYGLFGASKRLGRFTAELVSGGQLVFDQQGNHMTQHIQFTPNGFVHYDFRKLLNFKFLYKRNFRLPSFNELYFGQIGNHGLKPEIAHQFNAQIDWTIRNNYYRWHWNIKTDGFVNRVRDKIVAVPSKNLFIWTIQNVQEALVYGGTIDSRATLRRNRESRVEILANYTWQRVIDITPNAITHGHQVAYAPEHLANFDILLYYKGITGRLSNNFVSGRYALNENVPQNYLDPFWTMDVALGYKYELKGKHKIGVQLNIRNVTDASYAFIRSFVMPGRHYLLTLNYEIF
jgi:outer membrane cobalamin receptor